MRFISIQLQHLRLCHLLEIVPDMSMCIVWVQLQPTCPSEQEHRQEQESPSIGKDMFLKREINQQNNDTYVTEKMREVQIER